MAKVRVLFVCLGNICRSPMAEMIFREMLRAKGMSEAVEADSAATSAEELGNSIYPAAQAELRRHGVPCTAHQARVLRRTDYAAYDLLIGMETRHLRAMERICGGDPQGKMHRLMDLTARPGDLADPWYTRDFAAAYQDIREGCEGLLRLLMNEQAEHEAHFDNSFGIANAKERQGYARHDRPAKPMQK